MTIFILELIQGINIITAVVQNDYLLIPCQSSMSKLSLLAVIELVQITRPSPELANNFSNSRIYTYYEYGLKEYTLSINVLP
jgi:hypothetical protein